MGAENSKIHSFAITNGIAKIFDGGVEKIINVQQQRPFHGKFILLAPSHLQHKQVIAPVETAKAWVAMMVEVVKNGAAHSEPVMGSARAVTANVTAYASAGPDQCYD